MAHGTTTLVEPRASLKAWVVCLGAALFFFYEFIQMNMFNVISIPLMHEFGISAAQLGSMSAYYFIANVLFLFPAGIILDRVSVKKVILVSLALSVLGTALFSFSHSLTWATFFRFLTGIGGAFCFLSCLRLASRWFPARQMALITGCIVTMAMLGGAVAQAPLELLIEKLTWRQALQIDAAFGVLIFLVISAVVKEYPDSYKELYQEYQKQISEMGFFKSLNLAFLRMENWLPAIYTCLMNLPVVLLGGLWGTLYLVNAYGLGKLQAAHISSMLFIGTIVGSPLSGWISDRLALRRVPMLIGAALSLVLMLILIYSSKLNFVELLLIFLFLGVFTSTQIISYPFVAETSPRVITAMSVSVVNITTQGGIALFQPFFGFLLDLHAHSGHSGENILTVGDFHWAMWIFPIGFIIALMAIYATQESYARIVE